MASRSKTRGGLPSMPRAAIAALAGWTMRRCRSGSWRFPSPARVGVTAMSENRREHDRQTRSLARSRHRGADPGDRLASRHRGRARRRARRWPNSRACARSSSAQRLVRCDAEGRRPLPCHRPRAGADRADLRGDARSDRERHRRGDRPDVRAAGANSRACRSRRRGRSRATPKFRIRRSRSSNGVIDLGRLATDALFLAIDPYPRRPDAVFEPPVEAADPEDSSVCRAEGAAARRQSRRSRRSPKASAEEPRNACDDALDSHSGQSQMQAWVRKFERNTLNYHDLFGMARFRLAAARQPKERRSRGCVGAGKRYCRGPAGAQRCASPIAAILAISKSAAEALHDRKRSGFRDVHAAKGSNRA